VADQVAFLANGQILEHNSAQEFFAAPQTEVARRFLDRVLKY
jgi:ABC-type polar amino acid transport system ATPase subunit